ncbi:MAG TPA: amino acid adenylation domain-containing protein [Longimicrobiaceae bacterium]|nr:amino acid adenylation domain-containing protein [Longimicrobiaceae bacterium]
MRATLPHGLVRAARALAREAGATPYMVLLAGFKALLSRHVGEEDVVVGTPVAGRERAETEGLIGFFVNTLALRTRVVQAESFRALLARVRETTLAGYVHQHAPYERVVAELQPLRETGTPLFRVMFAYNTAPEPALRLPGLDVRSVDVERGAAKFDLMLSLEDGPGAITGAWEFDAELFARSSVEALAARFVRLLEAALLAPHTSVEDLPLLSDAEREAVLAAGRGAELPVAGGTLYSRFAAQAARTPDAVAVEYGPERITYVELDERAGRLAGRLRAVGVGPEVRVGVCMERSPDLVISLLAVLRAGGAYVPLDPCYPADRLAHMLADSSAAVLLTRSRLADRLPAGVALVVIDGVESPAGEDASTPATSVGMESLAYVIYTSGSTGLPKGVGVPHGALVNHMAWMQRVFPLEASDRILQKTSHSFDASVWEFWAPLLAGATLVLAGAEGHRDPVQLLRTVETQGITILQLVPSFLRTVLDEAGLRRRTSLRRLFCGGEALPVELARRAHRVLGAEVVNLYGPTEVCIDATSAVHRGPEAGSTVPIGQAVDNVRAYVLDGRGDPVPVGVPGELYLGGAQLARGYLGRPEGTAERFVPDPFGGWPGARLYRSGDRVRWLAPGMLEYLGRLDEQVKVRGYRVEPGEVEALLRRLDGVRSCAVVVREGEPGERCLVAYVVGTMDVGGLRARLRQALPEHMIPGAIVELDSLPLTPNGKLDRRALPAPACAVAGERHVEPRTPVEEVLAGIWAEVLRVEPVGVTVSFFELGGHSLLATRVASRVREVFGIELPLRALFDGPTVAELAARVEAVRRAASLVLPPVLPAARTGALPLSFAQERLWFLDQLGPGSGSYNVPRALRLRGVLDRGALERALGETVRRHETLRTCFRQVDGSPVQVVAPYTGVALPVVDLSGLGGAERDALAKRRSAEEASRPFNLSAGPLFRVLLLALSEREHVLLLCMHHIVSDAWSTDVLHQELSALYAVYRDGGEPALPELPVQYADYAVWQREHLRGETLERQLAYWRARLEGAPELLELPTDHPRPPTPSFRGGTVPVEVPGELVERLQALGRSEGATLFMVLLGAFQVLLSKYGGSEDVVVGSPVAGRTRREVEGLIGCFVNPLVLRTDLAGDPTFRGVLRRVREVGLGGYEHQEVPFEKVVAELQPERSLGHSPLFQVTLTVQSTGGPGLRLPGLAVSDADVEFDAAKFDLSLVVEATPQGLLGGLTYSADLFERGTIQRMVGHLERVLEQVAEDPEVRLSGVGLMGEAERAQVIEEWTRKRAELPVDRCIHERFEAQAERTPDAVALVCQGTSLTYAELKERSDRIAHRLRGLGVGPEVRVGLCLERSPGMLVAILGVLRAGGTYVPIDPTYPPERISYLLEDSGAALVVAQDATRSAIPASAAARVLALEALLTGPPPGSIGVPLPVEVSPESTAYVIYTSGSTGRPKGVLVTHANVLRLFDATDPWFGFGGDDVWTLFHSYTFDFSVWEIWGALLYGGRLVVVPFVTTRSPEDFHRLLLDEGVTVLSQTPSAFKQLVQADRASDVDPSALSLRYVVFGGEALDTQALRPWMERHGDERPRLVNMYGITETTVHVTYHVITRADLERPGSPIGVPIPDLSLHVLDANLEPVPVGVPGEIFVGGAGVACGYLNRPELTAGRFVCDPFSSEPGARLYRSGDLARRRVNGELEYLGRADHQVKLRGFRIETGEIEAVLCSHQGVGIAAVVVREDTPGDRRLVAYAVPAPGAAEPAPAELRAHLVEVLPSYMVPAAIVLLERLPLTENGKLDRRALPAPAVGRPLGPGCDSPTSESERLLQEVWQDVLGVEQVGVLENFFAAGGDSLRAVQVIALLRDRGMDLTVRDLFQELTIRGLASRFGATSETTGAEEAPAGGVPHHLADLPDEEIHRVRAVFGDQLEDAYPATRMQAVMLFAYAKDAARDGVYHPQQCHRLTDASLSVGALRHAIEQLVCRHAIFRTTFTTGSDGAPLQVVRRRPPVLIDYQDLRELPREEQERAVQARIAEDLDTPFDPYNPTVSLIRFVIFHREDGVADLLISAHHAVEDGWGNVHFLNTLFEAYADARDGRKVSSAPVPNTYREFVALEGEILASREAQTFWRDRMRQASPAWPVRRGGTGGSQRECRVVRKVSPELTAALREAASRESVALKAIYLSPYLDMVAMLSSVEDACAGVVWNGRSERLSDPLTALGLFWNLLPVARPFTAPGGAAGRARAVHEGLLEADLFGRYPLAEIMAANGGGEPFFATFNFLHFRHQAGPDVVRGGRVEPVYVLDRLHLPFNLAVSLAPRTEGGGLHLEYDECFFSRADAVAALDTYLLRLGELTGRFQ